MAAASHARSLPTSLFVAAQCIVSRKLRIRRDEPCKARRGLGYNCLRTQVSVLLNSYAAVAKPGALACQLAEVPKQSNIRAPVARRVVV